MSDPTQASLLTESQREYLRNGTKLDGGEVSNPYEYDKGIRKRLARLLMDMGTLFDELDGEELRKVFSEPYAPITIGSNGDMKCDHCGEYVDAVDHDCRAEDWNPNWYATAPRAMAFLVWALNVDDEPPYPPFQEQQPAFGDFVEALERGVEKYLSEKHNLLATVDVQINLQDVDRVDELYEE